jgi:hypothetical protein
MISRKLSVTKVFRVERIEISKSNHLAEHGHFFGHQGKKLFLLIV